MNRFEEMDNLLKLCKQLCDKHPDADFSRTFFDRILIKYGIKSNNESNIEYDTFFEYWKQRFQSVPNIKVYESEYQKGFLQFDNDHYSDNHIKIYLSIPPSTIVKSVDIIFDYLSQNNIGHLSKVAKADRSDVLVLRIEKEEDVPKVLQYVNSIPYIRENARTTNPFIMRNGIAGITFDGMLSYNRTVSLMLSNYVKSRQEKKETNSICLNDFINYIIDYYRKTFIDKTNLKSFMEQDDVQNEVLEVAGNRPFEKYPSEKVLINYMYVIRVLMLSLSINTSYNDFIDEFKNYNNNIHDDYFIEEFGKVLNKDARTK